MEAKKAQGSLEYLIIIAAVLAIAAIVILFVTGSFGASKSSADVSKCKIAAAKCSNEKATSQGAPCDYCERDCPEPLWDECKAGEPDKIIGVECEKTSDCKQKECNTVTCTEEGYCEYEPVDEGIECGGTGECKSGACVFEPKIESLSFHSTSNPINIFVKDNLAYVADGRFGWKIFNVTDKLDTPKLLYIHSNNNKFVRKVFVDNNKGYVAAAEEGWKVFNASKQDEIYSNEIANNGVVYDVFADNDYSYVIANNNLSIFRMDKIQKPELIGSLGNSFSDPSLFVKGNFIYVTSGNYLKIINATDKSNLKIISSVYLKYSREVFVQDDYAYIANDKNLSIVRITDKTNPVLIKSIQLNGYKAQGVFVSGQYVYISDDNGGVKVINIEDKNNPKQITEWSISSVLHSFVKYPYIYSISATKGLHVGKIENF